MTTQQAAHQQYKKRTGLLQIKVGSNHFVKCADGVKRQFEVKNVDAYPSATKVCVCLTTNTVYPTYAEMFAAQPSAVELRKSEESIVWGYWSEDTEESLAELEHAEREYELAKAENPKATRRAVSKAKSVDYSKILGLLAEYQE